MYVTGASLCQSHLHTPPASPPQDCVMLVCGKPRSIEKPPLGQPIVPHVYKTFGCQAR